MAYQLGPGSLPSYGTSAMAYKLWHVLRISYGQRPHPQVPLVQLLRRRFWRRGFRRLDAGGRNFVDARPVALALVG